MTTYDARGLPQFATSDKIAANGDGLREDLNLIGASASAAIGAEGARVVAYADGRLASVDAKNATQDDTLDTYAARLANLDNAAGFTGDPLALNDAAVKEAVTSASGTKAALDAAYTSRGAVAGASDPLAYIDNVSLLVDFPVRENGELSWPQGFSINKAANEIYVSNQNATELRIDVRDLTTGARKSYKTAVTEDGAFTESLSYFTNGNGELCFIVWPKAGGTSPSAYAIFNYTLGTLGPQISIYGFSRGDVSGNYLITSDAWTNSVTRFYVYDWASVQAGTPNLVATIPVENTGATAAKNQGLAIVGGHLYLAQGAQGDSPTVTVWDFTGKLRAVRQYSRTTFQTAVNVLKPGYLTNNSYTYETEGATNLGGKLVTGQIVNNNPAAVSDSRMLILQHNRIDGAQMTPQPITSYVYDTGWQPLTLEGTWTVANGKPPMYRRIGNEVSFKGGVTNTTASTTLSPFATLPAGVRPTEQSGYAISSNANTVMNLQILTNGSMQLYSAAVTTAWRQLNGVRFLLD